MANEEKLLNLVNVVGQAHERGEWDQKFWAVRTSCGTSMCAAGWACAIEGHQFDYDYTSNHNAGMALRTTTGECIEDLAAEILGLTVAQSAHLFHANQKNDYDEFVETVKRIIDGSIP